LKRMLFLALLAMMSLALFAPAALANDHDHDHDHAHEEDHDHADHDHDHGSHDEAGALPESGGVPPLALAAVLFAAAGFGLAVVAALRRT
jgi:hypothetical protein